VRLKLLGIFAASLVGMTLASCATAGERDDVAAALALLREGGNIIVMRHATSPSDQKAAVGLTEGCELAPGRGLSAQGFFEARFIAEWFAENDVKIDRTYTSDLCRSYDTARLVAAAGNGPVIPRAEMKSDDSAIAEAFRTQVLAELAAAPASNILLVSHSNITPLYWAGPLDGEEETPSGRVHIVRNGATTRIDINPDLAAVPAVNPSPER
jgi:broad specificity phosphatase PhoE